MISKQDNCAIKFCAADISDNDFDNFSMPED